MEAYKVMLQFAKELKEISESLEEELEILSNKDLVRRINKSLKEFKEGKVLTFRNVEELRKKVME